MPEQESERLRRLRERQLADRDPLLKQQRFQRESSLKERRMRKPFSLAKAWGDLPHVVRSSVYGLVVGILIIIGLPSLWPSPYALPAGVGVTLVLLILGAITGNTLDLRDKIKDQMK
jgi:hypothetical protein